MKNINKILNVGDVLEAKIETASESGKGVIKVQDIILFVPDVKEGEIVRIKIIKLFKKIGFAEVTSKKETENETKYYRYIKEESKYLMVAFRILNGEGFVITSYMTKKIQK